ncbi:MAG TPA: hypothetical protein VGC21_13705 [Telluria sp.]|jgi:hypothetical protein
MKKVSMMGTALLMAATGASALPIGGFSVTATFSPATVAAGQNSTFTWNSPSGTFCEVEGLPGGTRTGRSGSYTFTATASLSAFVSCERMDVFSGKSASLNVIAGGGTPAVTSNFNPPYVYINTNGSTNGAIYSWNSSYTSNCTSSTFGALPTSGSMWVGASYYVSTLSDTITCTGANGSAASTATLDTLQQTNPLPTVLVIASPAYLSRPGYTDITYNATNYTHCTGQGRYFISESTGFSVSCYGPGGTGTGYNWVEVANSGTIPRFASASTASMDGKPVAAKGAVADLKPLGIDLGKKRYAYVENDLNNDGAKDLLVHDKLKMKLYVVLAKDGAFPAISRSIDNVHSLTEVKAVAVPASNLGAQIRVTLETKQ